MGVCRNCEYYIPDGAFLCVHCGCYQRKWPGFLSILGRLATIVTMIFIGVQSYYINKQTSILKDQSADIRNQTNAIKQQMDIIVKKFTLEDRPYFYVIPKPSVSLVPKEGGDQSLLAGVLVAYGNFGNYYAKDIELIDYKLFSDKQLSPYPVEEYWRTTYGGPQEYNSVPPKVSFNALDCRADMGIFKENEKRYIQFSMRVKYKGINEKEYKFGLDYIFVVDGVKGGAPYPLILSSKEFLAEDGEELPEIKYLIDERRGIPRHTP